MITIFTDSQCYKCWDFPGGPLVNTTLPMQGAQVLFLVRGLEFHMLHSVAEK